MTQLMMWNRYPQRKPDIGQKVLIFTQGYDVTGTRYWSDYEIAVYVINPHDKRKRAFANATQWEVESRRDGSILRDVWLYRGVTHWMPLPEPPEKISKEAYAELAGYTYQT
jgi:hypothetical protein